MLRNFVMDVCGCKGDRELSSFAERTIEELREKIGNRHVLPGLIDRITPNVCAFSCIRL